MRIIVLFNLRPGIGAAGYEAWAAATDIPTVRGLASIAGFNVFAATHLLGSDATPPFAYVEIIDVADTDAFGVDIATPAMQRISAEFQAFADNPAFMVMRNVGASA